MFLTVLSKKESTASYEKAEETRSTTSRMKLKEMGLHIFSSNEDERPKECEEATEKNPPFPKTGFKSLSLLKSMPFCKDSMALRA